MQTIAAAFHDMQPAECITQILYNSFECLNTMKLLEHTMQQMRA